MPEVGDQTSSPDNIVSPVFRGTKVGMLARSSFFGRALGLFSMLIDESREGSNGLCSPFPGASIVGFTRHMSN